MLLSNVAGTYLGDPALEPLFAALDEPRSVRVRPSGVPAARAAAPPTRCGSTSFPFETVRAVANLIYSGTLERHPGDSLAALTPRRSRAVSGAPDRVAGRPRARAGTRQAPAGALAYLSRPVLRHRSGEQRARARRHARGHRRSSTSCSAPTGRTPRSPSRGTIRHPRLDVLGTGDRSAVDAGNAARARATPHRGASTT